MKSSENLRVAFVAGTLGLGGAEKQLLYMSRALHQAGVSVHVYSLTRGEHFESELRTLGVHLEWIGKHSNPLLRLAALAPALRNFRPHIVQAAHFYMNLYVALLSPLLGAAGLGSIRTDLHHELEENPFWGPFLLRAPHTLIANSYCGQHNAELAGIEREKVLVLTNAIDLEAFDAYGDRSRDRKPDPARDPTAVVVGRLVPAKRYDRFISALILARRENRRLKGIIIGDGPERSRLESLARQGGLSETELMFLGKSNDIPGVLKQSDIFIQTSDHEGFPNVLLEAMAARLPVITTPAGDSDNVIIDGQTGYVVPFDDIHNLASRMVQLAQSPELRREMGQAGRARVEQNYDIADLGDRMLALYSSIAARSHSQRLAAALSL